MTRINGSIPPECLEDSHLQAEYYEMLRIPNAVKTKKVNLAKIPKEFCLGAGHVTFFYNKLLFLHKRFLSIVEELQRRNFNTNMTDAAFHDLPSHLYQDYPEIPKDLIIERILTRAAGMKRLRYNHEPITLEQYEQILSR